jgi:Zn-dependent peptidase ImmA (M78 family)/transcriptional regulator with XRE-family HTH domain
MIGRRLKLARDAAGWSLRDLEEQIEGLVTAQAIGKYERDEMMPSSKVLMALSRALGVSVDYLLSEQEMTLEEVDFRKLPASGAKEEKSVEAMVIDAMERYLELEAFFPDAMVRWQCPALAELRLTRLEDAEDAAAALRTAWHLGIDPIDSMTELLEGKGIKVIQVPLPTGVSGSKAFACPQGADPLAIIVVNKNDNGERQRLTLAHELAHFVIDWETATSKEHEKAADWFAGAFLVAREKIERVLGKARTAITFGELEAAKRIFKVSLAALAMRLRQLGIITKATFGEIWSVLVVKGLTRPGAKEPFAIDPEEPANVQRLALRAVAEGLISESKAAQLLRVRLKKIESMLYPELTAEPA